MVLPSLTSGARILPVGPRVAAMASSDTDFETEYSLTFLPLIAISLEAFSSSCRASSACNFLLAGTFSLMVISLASRNLDARLQLVQPFLK